jgi:hypothetical protein
MGATILTAATVFAVIAFTQAALWTLALSYGLLYLLLRSNLCTGGTSCVPTPTAFDELGATYLFLLGGSFAAAAAGKVAVATKVSAGTICVDAAATGVLTDDDGNADLADTQFFMFNMLALVYFAVAFIHKPWDV